jgi:hypothetical protein
LRLIGFLDLGPAAFLAAFLPAAFMDFVFGDFLPFFVFDFFPAIASPPIVLSAQNSDSSLNVVTGQEKLRLISSKLPAIPAIVLLFASRRLRRLPNLQDHLGHFIG